jgi:MYXO-CTERM domain-containing protein
MESLGGLAGHTNSQAHAVSADGSIIAGSSGGGGDMRACVWTSAYGAINLQDHLAANGVSLAGWTRLTSATAISADGLTITGYGEYAGANLGFVVQLGSPIPAPGALGLLGLAGLAARRRRR